MQDMAMNIMETQIRMKWYISEQSLPSKTGQDWGTKTVREF